MTGVGALSEDHFTIPITNLYNIIYFDVPWSKLNEISCYLSQRPSDELEFGGTLVHISVSIRG